jgi:hypothetical protein
VPWTRSVGLPMLTPLTIDKQDLALLLSIVKGRFPVLRLASLGGVAKNAWRVRFVGGPFFSHFRVALRYGRKTILFGHIVMTARPATWPT